MITDELPIDRKPPSSRSVIAGAQGRVLVARPAPSVISVGLAGRDVGDLADALGREIQPELEAPSPPQLFVDARRTVGVTMMMSHAWARWFVRNRDRLGRVALLTGSGFLRLTGDFVRSFAGLDQKLELFVDPAAFQRAQAHAARARREASLRHV
jgi:hypothetical protein